VEVGIGLDHASPLVLGLVNIRGEIVPMLDTAAALGTRASHRLGPQNRSLVIRDTRDRRTALPVDQVESIEPLAPEAFEARGGDDTAALIRRVGIGEHAGGALTLLDVGGLRRAGADACF
jgi:chemotaxis signal transduction protein